MFSTNAAANAILHHRVRACLRLKTSQWLTFVHWNTTVTILQNDNACSVAVVTSFMILTVTQLKSKGEHLTWPIHLTRRRILFILLS